MSNNKFMKLSRMCAVIGSPSRHQETDIVKLKVEAAALARELFPPFAKPLVWDEEPTPFDQGHRYSYGSVLGKVVCQCGMYQDGTHYGHFRAENLWLYAATREEVKAACEAHHQARFLEQLA